MGMRRGGSLCGCGCGSRSCSSIVVVCCSGVPAWFITVSFPLVVVGVRVGSGVIWVVDI